MKKEVQSDQMELFDEKGDKILISGKFNNRVFQVGILLAVLCLAMLIVFPLNSSGISFDFFDMLIVGTSVVTLVLCIREIILNTKRSIAVTPSRVFGHTGQKPFDLPYGNIASAEQKLRNNFLYGNIPYIYIRTKDNAEYQIEQIKNLKALIKVLDGQMEKYTA